MSSDRAKEILAKYQSGEATEMEKALVEDWVMYAMDEKFDLSEAELLDSLAEIRRGLEIQQAKVKRIPLWYGAAAAVLVFLAAAFLLLRPAFNDMFFASQYSGKDIAPGSNKAVLTLADGRKIILGTGREGRLAVQGTASINKTAPGLIVYNAGSQQTHPTDGSSGINTITTPPGGEFIVVLSDGSRVHLNSGSSLRFPVIFNGPERQIELSGEAYFEVAHNKHKPLTVTTGGQTVEVLGTRFNLNAYTDERAVTTTLIEGLVKVKKGQQATLLKPGQQARTTDGQQTIKIDTADMESAVAWTNGQFQFNHADLQTVMRHFARWYDVKVFYKGQIPERHFSGSIHKSLSLFQALELLDFADVRFKTEGRKITITE